MRKLREKIAKLMYGRYGSDNLNNALFGLCFVLIIVNLFMSDALRLVFSAAEILILALIIYRCFSKNIYKRSAENRKYLALKGKAEQFFSLAKARWRDRKTHVYKKCPSCKATLRLPKKKGEHLVDCPKCKKEFKVKI